MNLHEYQARALLKDAGIPVPDGDVAATADEVAGSPSYTGQDGSRYWAGEFLSWVDDNSDTVVFGPIPVSGFTNLAFSGLFAADGIASGIPRYDAGEGQKDQGNKKLHQNVDDTSIQQMEQQADLNPQPMSKTQTAT